MKGARIINRRPVTMNAGWLDSLDIQREGFKRSEELRRSTGVSGKQIARESADHEFQIWWDYHGAEESELSRAEAKTEWLKGFRGRGWGSHNPTPNVEGSAEYQRAYEKSALAIREFKEAQQAYRARRIGDAEFLRARAEYDKAMAEYDAAYSAEQERGSNPYAAIASPHELFHRAHHGLSGSWDVRRAGYHGKLEVLESGLTESKARALAASANAEIRKERETFFETQPIGAYHTYSNPAWFGYYPRFVPEGLWNELVNLWHLSRTAKIKGSRYERMLWTSGEFHKDHPEISSTAAYKDLDGFLAYSGK